MAAIRTIRIPICVICGSDLRRDGAPCHACAPIAPVVPGISITPDTSSAASSLGERHPRLVTAAVVLPVVAALVIGWSGRSSSTALEHALRSRDAGTSAPTAADAPDLSSDLASVGLTSSGSSSSSDAPSSADGGVPSGSVVAGTAPVAGDAAAAEPAQVAAADPTDPAVGLGPMAAVDGAAGGSAGDRVTSGAPDRRGDRPIGTPPAPQANPFGADPFDETPADGIPADGIAVDDIAVEDGARPGSPTVTTDDVASAPPVTATTPITTPAATTATTAAPRPASTIATTTTSTSTTTTTSTTTAPTTTTEPPPPATTDPPPSSTDAPPDPPGP